MNNQVLVIEDDSVTQDIYLRKLTEAGLNVHMVTTGQEGLDYAETQKPGVIILDIMLPGGMNGVDILKRLKTNDTTKAIPVVVMTNLDSVKQDVEGLQADAYFVKTDVSMNDVVAKVESILKDQPQTAYD